MSQTIILPTLCLGCKQARIHTGKASVKYRCGTVIWVHAGKIFYNRTEACK